MTRCPAERPLRSIIDRVLPGVSEATVALRERILQVCADPTANAVLIRGPVGVGKSTVARLIAFGKRIALLREDAARGLVEDLARFEAPGLIHTQTMSWYVEFAVTGLVDELAEAQLFGIGRQTATGVSEKPGVFEVASKGQGGDDRATALTGGIVFLDEIGDLSPTLQTKLLPVLAGAVYYRLGHEGLKEREQRFRGVTICASWKDLDSRSFRTDLLSRIASTTIPVPTATERRQDLPLIVDGITRGTKDWLAERLKEMEVAEPDLDKAYIDSLRRTARSFSQAEVQRLQEVDWSRFGELRGLTQVVRKVIVGARDLETALAELPDLRAQSGVERDNAADLLEALSRTTTSPTLGGRMRDVELLRRRALKGKVLSDPSAAAHLAHSLDTDAATVRKQARQLDRQRRRTVAGEG